MKSTQAVGGGSVFCDPRKWSASFSFPVSRTANTFCKGYFEFVSSIVKAFLKLRYAYFLVGL